MLVPGLEKLESHEAEKALENAPKYVVRSAAAILSLNPEPPVEIWGGITLTNDIFQIIGASGVGKSRIVLNLALRQVLAETKEKDDRNEFAGLPLYRGRLKWLVLGTENSLYRYYADLSKMLKYCTEEQLRAVDERLFLTTLEGDGDSYMAVDNKENVAKLRATIASVEPDIVVFDPWGDICGGSELDDRVVRETVAVLKTLRRGVKDTMPIVIVNHARMGAVENAKAYGLDAANFGKNSKALYTICRAVWNLSYATSDPSAGTILFTNAKRSNGPLYAPSCVQLDPDQMAYSTVADFDFQAARAEQILAANGPRQNDDEVRSQKFKKTVEKGIKAALEAVAKGPVSKSALDSAIREVGVPVRDVPNVIAALEKSHGFESERGVGKNSPVYWGTHDQILAIRREKEQNMQNDGKDENA